MRLSDGTYTRTQEIPFCDCDCNSTIKPSSLLRWLTNMAGDDYADRGFAHDALRTMGVVFLVSRINVRIHRNIRAEETVIFATYERGTKGPLCLRNYAVRDGNGGQIVTAKSAWVMCDPVTHRILRPKNQQFAILEHLDTMPDCPEPEKFLIPRELKFAGTRRVVYSDLDGNGHVNNAVYADIACDFLPLTILQKPLTGFAVSFQQEARYGDSLSISLAQDHERSVVIGEVGNAICFAFELLTGASSE
ncbi:MAG: thioesterase [Clostridia bacterium]